VAAMLQEPARAIDGSAVDVSGEDLERLADIAQHAEQFYCRTGKSLKEARDLVLAAQPFLRVRRELLEIFERRGRP